MPSTRHMFCAIIPVLFAGCHLAGRDAGPDAQDPRVPHDRLPTGARLDPAGEVHDVGSMPLSMIASPDGKYFVFVVSGYIEQGVKIVERSTGRVVQTLAQPAAFVGAAFSRDGRELLVSGANRDLVYRYAWSNGHAELRDSLILAVVQPHQNGNRFPAGLAVSGDGRFLLVAENLADSLAVVNLSTGQVTQRLATGRYPYDVLVARDGHVYVSAWGGSTVSVFVAGADGLRDDGHIVAGRHPSALLLNDAGTRLFAASGSTDRVTVIDTKRRRVMTSLRDAPPQGPGEGATPNGLALSEDGTRLYVAEADANAIAVFDLSSETADVAAARGDDRLAGRVPAGWYPTAVRVSGDTLWAVNGKGRGTHPNPTYPQPPEIQSGAMGLRGTDYTLGQLQGTLSTSLTARARGAELSQLTARVVRANGWDVRGRGAPAYPPFRHVIYVLKENRTYDQVFGDMRAGDGDTALSFYPRPNSPNHHAIADRFGLFDRFFVNAEVSADGHNWSMAAYASDYVEKTVQTNYSDRGRPYDYDGRNRDEIPDDDVNEPASGYLWNLAERAGISYRNYGELVESESNDTTGTTADWRAAKPFLFTHTNPRYPGWQLIIRDQHRADVWIDELHEFERQGEMPALETVYLPNDHSWGAAARRFTPRAFMADNDLALGRIIEALSQSQFWKNTVVFVLEDDAQSGPDHVDSHRSPLLVISPYCRAGTVHRFANTTDVLRTIEEILGLSALSQFDYYGRPLRDIWAKGADLRPYRALIPSVPLDQRNVASTRESQESELLDFRTADAADEDRFNKILWRTIKGPTVPYPGSRRISALELKR